MQLYVNYRRLNKIMIKNQYPLPLVNKFFDRLGYAKIFTKLDFCDMYHRIHIKKGNKWKTIFKTCYGYFKYLMMPFGLVNAPAIFQNYIHKVLKTLVDTIYMVYLNDIFIYLNNKDKNIKHVKQILQQLCTWGLYAKLSKCIFHTKNVKFLGFIITSGGIMMDFAHIKIIEEWPESEFYRDIQVFLGFANFYRQFIWNYLDTAYPLHAHLARAHRDPTSDGEKKQKRKSKGPTKWDQPWSWSWPDDAQQAFRKLRTVFTQAPLLRHFNPNLPLMVITEASDYAYGSILLQPSGQRDQLHWHLITYCSQKLTGPEVQYDTHDKELLAII